MATSATLAHARHAANNCLDLKRNCNENVPLGPFDSRVSAVIHFDGESYFVTTNADYIPALPKGESTAENRTSG
ncbi:hypothetical protein MSAN_00831700 [Mycena sanguinolenta]|uniref:Uncharacterized protein n=1 Tax=Mycena sanguinolenta TaxID=230812 RepID=A0A8H6YV44_9AGAR|nr:hypothetical protein MSAN_00831700 [Mycena sanguinolenta]